MHKDTLMENGATGFHGAMRLADRAGVLTCSHTTERMMERKGEGQTERERERDREGAVKIKHKAKCSIDEIYHTQAADHP